ncbi:MAG: PilZ domain-containing protein [Pseudomonadota bacterium]
MKPPRNGTGQVDQRRHYRKKIRVVARYGLAGRECLGHILDICPQGIRLEVGERHEKGELMKLRFQLSPGHGPFEVLGKIVYAQQRKPSGSWCLGIRFHGLGHAEEKAIAFYMFN